MAAVRVVITEAIVNFCNNMLFNTPFVRAATLTEITPASAAGLAANWLAAWTVDMVNEGGTQADAAFGTNAKTAMPPESAMPGRASLFANKALAFTSRVATVPSGQPSWKAASLRVFPLQIAQEKRSAVLVRQPGQFLLDQGLQIVPTFLDPRFGSDTAGRLPLLGATPNDHRSGLHRRAAGDAVQPVADHRSWPDGRRFANENEKGRLEGVLRVGFAAQHTPADAQDHRAMSPHQRLKSGLIPPSDETLQQLRSR